MSKNRLEAFSDGVLAIIITIMVLEIRAPEEASFQALKPLIPQLVIYLLSFFYMAIYWVNHKVIWTNMAWLFMALVMLMWFMPDQQAKEWREKIRIKNRKKSKEKIHKPGLWIFVVIRLIQAGRPCSRRYRRSRQFPG